jgi:hypothetical protein
MEIFRSRTAMASLLNSSFTFRNARTLMCGILAATRDSFSSADGGDVQETQANGKRVMRFACSRKTL